MKYKPNIQNSLNIYCLLFFPKVADNANCTAFSVLTFFYRISTSSNMTHPRPKGPTFTWYVLEADWPI